MGYNVEMNTLRETVGKDKAQIIREYSEEADKLSQIGYTKGVDYLTKTDALQLINWLEKACANKLGNLSVSAKLLASTICHAGIFDVPPIENDVEYRVHVTPYVNMVHNLNTILSSAGWELINIKRGSAQIRSNMVMPSYMLKMK